MKRLEKVLRCKIVVYNFTSLTNADHKKVIKFLKNKAMDLEKIYKKELLEDRFTMNLFK